MLQPVNPDHQLHHRLVPVAVLLRRRRRHSLQVLRGERRLSARAALQNRSDLGEVQHGSDVENGVGARGLAFGLLDEMAVVPRAAAIEVEKTVEFDGLNLRMRGKENEDMRGGEEEEEGAENHDGLFENGVGELILAFGNQIDVHRQHVEQFLWELLTFALKDAKNRILRERQITLCIHRLHIDLSNQNHKPATHLD